MAEVGGGPLRVCVLQSSYQGSNSPMKDFDPPVDPRLYMPKEWTADMVYVGKATAATQIREAVQRGYDVFINLCDGAHDEDRAGLEVVRLLKAYGVAYTGADEVFYEPSKECMKMVCTYYDIGTAPFVFAYDDGDIEQAVQTLSFPVIVKHYNGYSSVGMTRSSRCMTADELRVEARRMIDLYCGALIEEFVDGPEYTVLVAENPDDASQPISFAPMECRFPEGETFKHFDMKWVTYDAHVWRPVEDAALADRLRDMAIRMFIGCRGRSYGRCDIRMHDSSRAPESARSQPSRAHGSLMMLEINPNCGIFYDNKNWGSADYVLANDPVGHEGFLRIIVQAALRAQAKATSPVAVKYAAGKGYGLIATRAIATGELVQQNEERPHVLVTWQQVKRRWGERMRSWFHSNAYPVSEDVYVMWSDDPLDWRPINHSCDPNTVLGGEGGLDLVARRPIARGEAVTMDYSTFCDEKMESFDCWCGSVRCRKRITGEMYLSREIADTYREHVSPYVRRAHIRLGYTKESESDK